MKAYLVIQEHAMTGQRTYIIRNAYADIEDANIASDRALSYNKYFDVPATHSGRVYTEMIELDAIEIGGTYYVDYDGETIPVL